MSRSEAEIVVVGAGASGLSVAACLRRRGRRPVVLHRDERVGAPWRDRYDRLHLHTTRRFSGLPGYPVPRSYGRFVAKDDYARYLEDYAAELGLDVRGSVTVRSIRREGDDLGWALDTERGGWSCRVVVVATGLNRRKALPVLPGAETFEGPILHSADYRSGRAFAGRRVLVVGIGNSGAEIATDLVEQGAAHVSIAVRTPPPIVPRQVAGIPVQLFGILLSPLPARTVDGAARAVRRLGLGDLGRYGLGPPGWGSFSARRPALIDVGFVRELKAGRVHVRGELVAFAPGRARFADGAEEEVEVVVAATGFRPALDELLDLPDVLDAGGVPRAGPGAASPYPNLYFAGFDETVRGQLFEAGRGARRLAAAIDELLPADSAGG